VVRKRREVTALEAVTRLAPAAKAVVCAGTCSSFGGIPSGNPNPQESRASKTQRREPRSTSPAAPRIRVDRRDCCAASRRDDGSAGLLRQAGKPLRRKRAPELPSPRRLQGDGFWAGGTLSQQLGCKGPVTQAIARSDFGTRRRTGASVPTPCAWAARKKDSPTPPLPFVRSSRAADGLPRV